ncbi:hypothetical protein GCK32_013804 [Trichostrongylus colubriformis]|uniref:Uncharacterized protein n=1 Tax=Trichostrongylus colubriformis TaxID=6319 RepID=A0AAN8FUD3_TRICO
MGESSPEPLDELDDSPRPRRVSRWHSAKVVREHNGSPMPSPTIRRTGTVPSVRQRSKGKIMGESSPEPLDELDDSPRSRRVSRWHSVKVVREQNGSPLPSHAIRRTGTLPARRSLKGLGDRLDPFCGQNSYLRVPGGHSGRTSPSVASNSSEPESCIGDRFQDDDDIDIGASSMDRQVFLRGFYV